MKIRIAAVFVSVLAGLAFGQQSPGNPNSDAVKPPLGQTIKYFEIRDAALIDGLAELSSKPVAGLHLGFEEIIRQKLSDQRDRSVRFSLRLENKTVQQILDALCRYDARYTWSTDGPSLNVYPRETINDSSYLLNIQLKQISLSNIPDPDQALTPLARQLRNQQLGYIQMGGENTYAEPWTVTLEDLTVRQFINRIAEHIGSRTSWVWQGGKDGRMFTFLKGGFHTKTTAD